MASDPPPSNLEMYKMCREESPAVIFARFLTESMRAGVRLSERNYWKVTLIDSSRLSHTRWTAPFLNSGSILRPASRAGTDQQRFMLIYLVASTGWILLTDWAISHLGLSALNTNFVHSLKGLAYVAFVGILLARLVGHYVRSAEAAQQEALDAQLELVIKLARAIEYRDDETGGHNERIACYTRILARELGFDDEASELLSFASVLHDVGKIGIPDSVLLKPGPLTPSERTIVQRHPEIGSLLLDGTSHPLGKLARSIAISHHERWDGTGYPNGLKGEAIPLEGRIVAVCDVYDALTSRRLYKAAWTSEMAVKEIVRGSGTAFDPRIVAAMLKSLSEIQAIRASDPKEQVEDLAA